MRSTSQKVPFPDVIGICKPSITVCYKIVWRYRTPNAERITCFRSSRVWTPASAQRFSTISWMVNEHIESADGMEVKLLLLPLSEAFCLFHHVQNIFTIKSLKSKVIGVLPDLQGHASASAQIKQTKPADNAGVWIFRTVFLPDNRCFIEIPLPFRKFFLYYGTIRPKRQLLLHSKYLQYHSTHVNFPQEHFCKAKKQEPP